MASVIPTAVGASGGFANTRDRVPHFLEECRPGVNVWMIDGARFEIPARYTPIKGIGQGAFGVVCSAKDTQTGENVAIKKMKLEFSQLGAKRTLREIKLLRHFQHKNIISIKDIFKPPSKAEFDDVYIVTELMDADLHQIIASSQPLSDDHIQYFIYQILCGLKYIHSAHVLHRDLKPSNIFLNANCLLKIADFGLARVANPEENHQGFMTEYVATRWYRAPEVILSWKKYDKAIDVWSVGCIFAELLCRKPLFQGTDYIHQITRITEILGSPSDDDIANIKSEPAKKFLLQLGKRPGIPFSVLFPNANPLALDLLFRMLTFNPSKRITVEEAMAHPYLAFFHDPNDEPTCPQQFNFDFERFPLTKEIFKEYIWYEMLAYHPEAQAEEFERQSRKQQLLQTQMVPVPQPYDQMLAFQQHQLMQRQLLQQQLLQQQRQLVAMHTNGGVQPPLEADPISMIEQELMSDYAAAGMEM